MCFLYLDLSLVKPDQWYWVPRISPMANFQAKSSQGSLFSGLSDLRKFAGGVGGYIGYFLTVRWFFWSLFYQNKTRLPGSR